VAESAAPEQTRSSEREGGQAQAVEVEGLVRRYGERAALDGVTFALPEGMTLGLFGPNGAGKSTLLRVLATLLRPHEGSVRVFGAPLPREAWKVRSRVGYLGHEPLLYRELTALENLDLFGRLYRVPERRERSGMLLERFGLWDVRGERVSTFSRGMTQRLALCRALLHDPSLVVLDEPFTALDEEGAALLDRELAAMVGGRTVVLSTHDPGRVAPLATQRLALA
jgi:heme exporter protein A